MPILPGWEITALVIIAAIIFMELWMKLITGTWFHDEIIHMATCPTCGHRNNI